MKVKHVADLYLRGKHERLPLCCMTLPCCLTVMLSDAMPFRQAPHANFQAHERKDHYSSISTSSFSSTLQPPSMVQVDEIFLSSSGSWPGLFSHTCHSRTCRSIISRTSDPKTPSPKTHGALTVLTRSEPIPAVAGASDTASCISP